MVANDTRAVIAREYERAYTEALTQTILLKGYLETRWADLPRGQQAAEVQELRAFAAVLRAILAGRDASD